MSDKKKPGKWQKGGPSPNPAGRPRADARVIELARDHTEAALRALIDVALHGESEAARVSAAKALLDRGWGRPRQSIEHHGDGLEAIRLVVVSGDDGGDD